MNHLAMYCLGSLMLLMAAGVSATEYGDCKSYPTTVTVTSVTVDGCDGPGCQIKAKKATPFEVVFETKDAIEKVSVYATFDYRGSQQMLELDTRDGCQNVECPLEAGKSYTYKGTVKQGYALPNDKVQMMIDLSNAVGSRYVTFLCFTIDDVTFVN